jgi:hypothetical protein
MTGRQQVRGNGMNSHLESGEHLVLFEQGGATVARVLQSALSDDALHGVRERLTERLHHARRALIIDCRDLPSGAAEQIGPLLYDLMVTARRRSPRVELCVVGAADQSTGDGKTLLMPSRFETVETAGESLGERPTGNVPVRFATGQSSQEPFTPLPAGNQWLQSPLGQIVLATLVIGLIGSLVTYSALASFRTPVIPRRRSDLEARVAIHGRVKAARGQAMREDPSAVVLAWPAYVPKAKYQVQSELLFRPQPMSSEPAVLVTRVNQAGQFAFARGELTGAAGADYHLLVISEQILRKEAPAAEDLRKLAQYLDDPASLLRERQYQLLIVSTGSQTAAEQNVVLIDDADKPVANATTAVGGP